MTERVETFAKVGDRVQVFPSGTRGTVDQVSRSGTIYATADDGSPLVLNGDTRYAVTADYWKKEEE